MAKAPDTIEVNPQKLAEYTALVARRDARLREIEQRKAELGDK